MTCLQESGDGTGGDRSSMATSTSPGSVKPPCCPAPTSLTLTLADGREIAFRIKSTAGDIIGRCL